MKNLPRVSHIDCAILRESLCACMPLAPSVCCKLIPYVYWTRGLWVTSKCEGAAVRELQGAHLNSPSVSPTGNDVSISGGKVLSERSH